MNFSKRFLIACQAIAIAAIAIQARAVTQVSSPAGLTGPLSLEDFEDTVFVPGVTFASATSTLRGTSNAFSANVTASGDWGLSTVSYPDPITVSFSPKASSVGMYFGNDDTCCSTGFTAFLDVYGTSGLMDTIGVVANMNDFADQFIGFNSAVPVTSVVIRYGSGTDVSLYTFIDDVQFSVAVPEPATFTLMGLTTGIGIICSGRMRR